KERKRETKSMNKKERREEAMVVDVTTGPAVASEDGSHRCGHEGEHRARGTRDEEEELRVAALLCRDSTVAINEVAVAGSVVAIAENHQEREKDREREREPKGKGTRWWWLLVCMVLSPPWVTRIAAVGGVSHHCYRRNLQNRGSYMRKRNGSSTSVKP
ncbi:hypothetical protein PIB30_088050, partial [Stylosanthes scabra]|nr:hypothetical protein [Stylosanthes scabra]